ncbi:MAG: aminopeptidase P family protein [Candidatus Levybacteria bacterium]|nr:aminopeptidase P family protein [Candidatus Levybacteria bacterium]
MSTPLAKLKQEFAKKKLDAVLISSFSNIVYLTNYSGFSKEEREAYLFITRLAAKRAKNQQYILTDGRYSQAIKKLVHNFKSIEISSKLSFEKALKQLIKKYRVKRMGFEGNNLTFLEHKKLSSRFNDLNHFSLNNLRAIKNKEEVSKIEKACVLSDKTFDYILKKIKLGVSEKEIANEIEFFIKKQGGDISFKPIVAFGKNSAIPHHQTSNQRLASSGQFVLLDFGVKLNNYCSDMTRTIFFGKPTAEQKRMYQTVLESQKKAIQQFSNLTIKQLDKGIKASKIDKIAREHIISKGYKTIPHSLGHGIGIDVHEAPRLSPKSKDILKVGMVFSIEPGIYIPNLGGVRIEDLVVLEKKGPRLLTHSPKNLIEL